MRSKALNPGKRPPKRRAFQYCQFGQFGPYCQFGQFGQFGA